MIKHKAINKRWKRRNRHKAKYLIIVHKACYEYLKEYGEFIYPISYVNFSWTTAYLYKD